MLNVSNDCCCRSTLCQKKHKDKKTHMGRKWKAMDTMYYKNVDIKIYANLSSLYQVVEKK